MNAAANGQRNEVEALRLAGNTDEPLVRAMRAIECTLGLDKRSPGGPKNGMCNVQCAP
jgi:hypothetical protein